MKTVSTMLVFLVVLSAQADENANLASLKNVSSFLPADPEHAEIENLIHRYSDGIRDQDVDAILSCLGPSFFKFRLDENKPQLTADHHPRTWQPELFLFGEGDFRDWLETYVRVSVPYENSITFKGSGSGYFGLDRVITEETGRSGHVTWDKVQNTWIVGKIEGQWKILGLFANCPNVVAETAWSETH